MIWKKHSSAPPPDLPGATLPGGTNEQCNQIFDSEYARDAGGNEATFAPIGKDHVRWEALLLLFVVFMVYIASPVITTGDSHFVIPAALSIIRHGDANIDEYRAQFPAARWTVHAENGHVWNMYPIGVPLLALPFVWIWDKTAHLQGADLESEVIRRYPAFAELSLASLFTAAAVALLFVYCRKTLSLPKAVLLAVLFAFGTSAYSTASRGLWQHGPSMLLFFAALLVYDRLPEYGSPGALILGGIVGFSYCIRPSNLLIILGFAALIAIDARRRLLPYFAGAAVGVAPLFVYDLLAFGTWSNDYYRMAQYYLWHAPLSLRVYGDILISPSRGLFIFSPFILALLYRVISGRCRRRYPWSRLEILLGLSCIVWFLGVGRLPEWWGGGSYGPRLLCELLPCLTVLLIPVVQNLSLERSCGARMATAAFILAGAFSVALHVRGATSWRATNGWNTRPPDINQAPERARSWSDPQFLSGLGALDCQTAGCVQAGAVTGEVSQVEQRLTSFRQVLISPTASLTLQPRQELKVPVRIANPGLEVWASAGRYPVNISYRWYERDRYLPIEGARTALPAPLGPNEAVDAEVRVLAPDRPGNFVLRISLVQEGVEWFMSKSNTFLELPAAVR